MKCIIYILDSLRADHLSCYGYHRKTTPNIDKIAQDGVIFENAFAQSTWTGPSAASILTGLYPSVHKKITRLDKLNSDIPVLPELLQRAGCKTVAFSAMGNVSSAFGYNRGFDEFYELYKEDSLIRKRKTSAIEKEKLYYEDSEKISLPLAEDINEFFFSWLDRNSKSDFFSFIWSIDTHDPFSPPREFRKFVNPHYDGILREERDDLKRARSSKSDLNHLIDLYDSEIYYNDYHIGQLVEKLKSMEIYDKTLLVITSDHGEAFYDQGRREFGHSGLPYDERIHVPLIVKLPNFRNQGTKIKALVQLIDVFPTVISYLKSSKHDQNQDLLFIQGENLVPLISGEKNNHHEAVYSETQIVETKSAYYSIRTDEWKYILLEPPSWCLENIKAHPKHFWGNRFFRVKERLYNLKSDSNERFNLKNKDDKILKEFKERFAEWRLNNKTISENNEKTKANIDEKTEEHLRQLGYL